MSPFAIIKASIRLDILSIHDLHLRVMITDINALLNLMIFSCNDTFTSSFFISCYTFSIGFISGEISGQRSRAGFSCYIKVFLIEQYGEELPFNIETKDYLMDNF